jgi:tetratricopeptide (TPR) repeat protein
VFTLTFEDAEDASGTTRRVVVPEGDRGLTVGRHPGCDVVLRSGQVSRRHARFGVRDGRLTVEDLGSHNGVRIAGRRIGGTATPLTLARFAHLTLGDVVVRIENPPRRVRAAAFGVVLLLALAAISAPWANRVRARTLAEPEAAAAGEHRDAAEQGAADAMALTAEARAALEADRFDEAAGRARQAIERDPVAVEPRRILAQAKRDAAASRSFAEAAAWEREGREDDALRRYAQISPRSRIFPRARIAGRQLRLRLERTHARACRSRSRAGLWQDAVVDCSRALDLRCQAAGSGPDLLVALLRDAERRAGRRVPWTCPPELGNLLADGPAVFAAGAEADSGLALAARYPDLEIRDAVALYVRGDASGALRALSNPGLLLGRSGREAQAAAGRIHRVDGRYRAGQTALLRRELARADEAWREALRADAELLPPGVRSFLAAQMRKTLAEAHRTAGAEKFANGQVASAHDEWMRGIAANPDDPALLDAIASLEKVADRLLSGPRGCETAALAARITSADPQSPAHAAAQEALSSCP